MSPETTEDDMQQHFGQLGIVKRIRQKRGYPDQWPFKIKVSPMKFMDIMDVINLNALPLPGRSTKMKVVLPRGREL